MNLFPSRVYTCSMERIYKYQSHFAKLICNVFLFTVVIAVPASAQVAFNLFNPKTVLQPGADTIYYPYYNNVQMIEIDHISAWERAYMAHQMAYATMSQTPMFSPSPVNVYLFRNRSGEIVKAFNTTSTLSQLTSSFRNLPGDSKSPRIRQATSHNTPRTHFSDWDDHQAGQSDFKGLYIIYNDSAVKFRSELLFFASEHYPTGMRVGLIDSLGNFFLPYEYTSISPLAGNILVVRENGLCGVINLKKEEVIPVKYDAFTIQYYDQVIFYKSEKINVVYDHAMNRIHYVDNYDWIALGKLYSWRYHSSTSSERAPERERGEQLFQFSKDGKIGFIDTNYTVVTPPVYDMISSFSQGFAVACRDKKFGYINEQGREVILCTYMYAEYFRKGVGVVQHEGKFRNIDSTGKLLENYTVEHESWRNNQYSNYSNIGHLKATCTILGCGLTKENDVFVVPPIYQSISPVKILVKGQTQFSDKIFIGKRSEKIGLVDTAGNVLLPLEYEYIQDDPRADGLRVVRKDRMHSGILNRNYEWVVPCIYEDIRIREGYFLFLHHGKYGLMDTTGGVTVPPVYEMINVLKNSRALVRVDTLYGMINMQGEVVIPIKFQHLNGVFQNGLCPFAINNKWGYIDTTGKIIIEAMFDQVHGFEKEITAVKKGDLWGFINQKGKLVVPYQYTYVGWNWAHDGFTEVQKNGKVGLMNQKGREVIPCLYDGVSGYSEQYGHNMKKDGQWIFVKAK